MSKPVRRRREWNDGDRVRMLERIRARGSNGLGASWLSSEFFQIDGPAALDSELRSFEARGWIERRELANPRVPHLPARVIYWIGPMASAERLVRLMRATPRPAAHANGRARSPEDPGPGRANRTRGSGLG